MKNLQEAAIKSFKEGVKVNTPIRVGRKLTDKLMGFANKKSSKEDTVSVDNNNSNNNNLEEELEMIKDTDMMIEEVVKGLEELGLNPLLDTRYIAKLIVGRVKSSAKEPVDVIASITQDEIVQASNEAVSLASNIKNGIVLPGLTANEIEALYKANNSSINMNRFHMSQLTKENINNILNTKEKEMANMNKEEVITVQVNEEPIALGAAEEEQKQSGGDNMDNLINQLTGADANTKEVVIDREALKNLLEMAAGKEEVKAEKEPEVKVETNTDSETINPDMTDEEIIKTGVDYDLYRESVTGLSINDIYAKYGEEDGRLIVLAKFSEMLAKYQEEGNQAMINATEAIVSNTMKRLREDLGQDTRTIKQKARDGVDSIGKYSQERVTPAAGNIYDAITNIGIKSATEVVNGSSRVGGALASTTGTLLQTGVDLTEEILHTGLGVTETIVKETGKAGKSILSELSGLLRK